MSPTDNCPLRIDLRCKACGILLGRLDNSGLTIERGKLQVAIIGHFHASIVCYRRGCQTLNVIHVKGRPEPTALVT